MFDLFVENEEAIEAEVETAETKVDVSVDPEVSSEPAALMKTEAGTMTMPAVKTEEVFCRGEWRVLGECESKTEIIKDGEVKGTTDEIKVVDEKVEIEDGHSLPEMEIKVQAERARNCTESGGIYDLPNDECLGVSGSMCTDIGGAWNECASACRNNPEAVVCTMQCVQICEFN